MQLTNILLSLAAVAGVINAAPAPLPSSDMGKVFSYSSCMTVTYDTPQGIAFYKIDNADADDFGARCKTCIEATMVCSKDDTQCKESKFAKCEKKQY